MKNVFRRRNADTPPRPCAAGSPITPDMSHEEGHAARSRVGEGTVASGRGKALGRVILCFWVALACGALLETSLAIDSLTVDDGRTRGDGSAPVVLIEYSDFTCGFCKKFFLETWPRLREKYVSTGKVLFVYKDYPRASYGLGVDAATAARCAGDQGQYWAMHDRLLGGGRLREGVFEQHARAIGLDVSAFATCRREQPYQDAIFRDKDEALQWGFRGTPGFILFRADDGPLNKNGEPPIGLPGALPFEVFEEQIERLLSGAPSVQRG